MQTTTEWTLLNTERWNRRHVNEKLTKITKSRKEQNNEKDYQWKEV